MKVGDRVKVIKDHVFPENIGETGYIYFKQSKIEVMVMFDNMKLKALPYTINELELVPEN